MTEHNTFREILDSIPECDMKLHDIGKILGLGPSTVGFLLCSGYGCKNPKAAEIRDRMLKGIKRAEEDGCFSYVPGEPVLDAKSIELMNGPF